MTCVNGVKKRDYGEKCRTEMELVLGINQQGSSHEIQVATERVEELKEFVRFIKGFVKKEALLYNLGRNRVNSYAVRITKMIAVIEISTSWTPVSKLVDIERWQSAPATITRNLNCTIVSRERDVKLISYRTRSNTLAFTHCGNKFYA
ncbi:hypothetical protein Tco_0743442 [Tanacetum coccineum]